MSTGETHRNLGDIVKTATLEGAKPGVTVIMPWRTNANQDHPHKDFDACGCGFCPEDDQETA
jgi:hypothetical protein